MPMSPASTLDKWSFTNRDVLHVAVSDDDGRTWHGFRELHRDRLRDSGEFVNAPGDKGQNESQIAETSAGNVLVAAGQAPGHRAFVLLDVDWLYETEHFDDFTNGLDEWSRQKLIIRPPVYDRFYHYNYNRKKGAVLVPHPDKKTGRVLHVRRPLDPTVFSQRDGAVWNFPASTAGTLTTRIRLNPEFGGGIIALQERWYQPTDSQGEDRAMCRVDVPADGKLAPTVTLETGRWYQFELRWQEATGSCQLTIDGKQRLEIPFKNGGANGISYVRFRSAALRPDPNGFYVEYVRVSDTR